MHGIIELAIHSLVEELKQKGIAISYDWTVAENGISSPEDSRKWSQLDVEGAKSASRVVVIMEEPYYPYRGSWTEVGVALGQNHPVGLYCPWFGKDGIERQKTPASNVFFYHPNVTIFTDWKNVEEWLTRKEGN